MTFDFSRLDLGSAQNPIENTALLHFLSGEEQAEIKAMAEGAVKGDESALQAFHGLLATLNKHRFKVSDLAPDAEYRIDGLRVYLENIWLHHERQKIQHLLADVPEETDAFVAWFENLMQTGPGQNHPLFDYLEHRATFDDFHFFMKQELATEAGFDDLVALTQVQAPSFEAKLELARNYWDEMGNGMYEKIHSVQLSYVSKALELQWGEHYAGIHWQPLALSNLMLAFASHRGHFYQSVGALGAIELTAPGRCKQVTQGLKRIGFTNAQYRYYALHAVLDIKHWAGWRDNAVVPLANADPGCCRKIAEGAILRLLAGARCFEVYSKSLHIDAEPQLAIAS